MKNTYLIIIIVIILIGPGGFFAGMKYQQSKMPSFQHEFSQNGSGARRQLGQRPGGAGSFQPVSGKVIEQDESSFTLELPDGSSSIILLTETSTINKTEEASSEDITEGSELVVFGQENSDGSITAQNIQIGSGFRNRFNQTDEKTDE